MEKGCACAWAGAWGGGEEIGGKRKGGGKDGWKGPLFLL